jgi:hypothetical protein
MKNENTLHSQSIHSSILKSNAQHVQMHMSSSINVTPVSVQHFLKKAHAWGDLKICMEM